MMSSVMVFQLPGRMILPTSPILFFPFRNFQFFQVLHPLMRMIDDASVQAICPEGLIVKPVFSQLGMKFLHSVARIFNDPELKTLKCHIVTAPLSE